MGRRVQVIFVTSLVLSCTISLALDDAATIKAPNVGTVSLAMKENPQLCQLCEQFASEALFYLNENETKIEIIDTLHQACSKFPSFKLECTSFCVEAKFIHLPRHEDACTLCHEVVDEIVTNLEDPDMEFQS
ncbi:uncharacterized protein LOC120699110 isoform X2 [Panicum virgatum]|uniref:uncharacterized protein LOC120699110 isoform X2 n=1 Tax=Panicum virgatum TaxID=38727 RepID=UPI0019D500B4|nr:uncharacterized protein LOC120699110 isoform X2 [Panicum virgatum]